VGGDHHVGEPEQRAVGARLGGEDVDARAADPAVLERQRERVLVHDSAPRGVDDQHAGLDEPEFPFADQAGGLRGLRQVHGDEVSLREQVLQRDQADAQLRGARGGHVGVIGDHLHAERGQPLGDQLPDPAEAEDPRHLPVELGAGELRPLPLARLERGHRLRHVAGGSEQQPDGVLGCADGVRAGRVHHHDACLGGGLDVDVVEAHAGAGEDAQVRRMRQRLGVDPCRAPDDHRVHVGERPEQRGPVGAVHMSHLERGFELGDRGG
jgi:hypothetical protein